MNQFERAMLRAALNSEDDDKPKRPEADVVADLKESARRYAAPCPFNPGEMVTPRKHSGLKGAGEAHIVLEVRARPEPHMPPGASPGGNTFGQRLDMRIACGDADGDIAAYWVESWQFDRWRAN